MKKTYFAVMGSLLLAAAPLYAADQDALAGATDLTVQSHDGSGSLGSSLEGALGTSGASSSSRSEGSLAAPGSSALDGYLGVGSGDFAKARSALTRAESAGTQTVEGVVQRATSSEHAASSSSTRAGAATSALESTVSRLENGASDEPRSLGFSTPASIGGLDVEAGLRTLALHGSAH